MREALTDWLFTGWSALPVVLGAGLTVIFCLVKGLEVDTGRWKNRAWQAAAMGATAVVCLIFLLMIFR